MRREEVVELLEIIDVWNCRGIVRNRKWLVARGGKPELPKGLEWLDVGNFSIPVPAGFKPSQEAKEQIQEVLYEVLNKEGGAINISGRYRLDCIDRERLRKAFGAQLEHADPGVVAKALLEELKTNANKVLQVWSSKRSFGCYEGCLGFHSYTYVYYDGNKWKRFGVGAHHVVLPRMWEIEPETISPSVALEELKAMCKDDFAYLIVYSDEVEEYIDVKMSWAKRLEKCDKHGYYLGDECPECF